ncbi:hypothetical protein ACH4D3_35775 [Streptomyces sp. NPDC018026]|uniref:hypothetical protein n=1 Tax=Streptomyces sp. NPDC018026 TaxID=3365031 RepID=UPI0037A93AF3
MFETIRWRCHVRASDRRGAERVVGRLARIATPWSLGAPGTDGEFDGVASANTGSRFAVAGVEWMEFYVTGRRV